MLLHHQTHPSLTIWDDHDKVEIGGNALIECLTAAHPKSLNFWHDKNDQFIRSDQRWDYHYEHEHEMKSCCFSGMTSTSAQWRRGLHHITTPSCASRFSMSHVSWRQCSRTLWTFQPFSPNDFPSSSSNIAITGLEGPLNRNRGSITSLTLGCAHICSSLQLKTRRLFAPNSRTRQWPISLLNPLLQFKFRRRPGEVQLQGEEQSRVDWWRNHFVWWVF